MSAHKMYSSRPTFSYTGNVTLEVERQTERGTRTRLGEWVPPTRELIQIEDCNVQPLGYRDLISLPESERTKEYIRVFSPNLLQDPLEGVDGSEGDVILWEGKRFRVIRCYNYSMGVLDHFKAIAVRERISAKGV